MENLTNGGSLILIDGLETDFLVRWLIPLCPDVPLYISVSIVTGLITGYARDKLRFC